MVHVTDEEHDPARERALVRELEPELAMAGVPRERVTFKVCAGATGPDAQIVATAEASAACVVAVGAHQRSAFERLWRQSISRGVVHRAPMSVLVVPQQYAARRVERPTPAIREVLAATDFSDLGNRAIPYALALLRDGGVLHLVHVHRPSPPLTPVTALYPTISVGDQRTPAETAARLEQMVPSDAAPRGISVQIHVLEGNVADAICAAAERLAVDAICIASRARPAVNAAVIGSATLDVLARTRRPVFVVRTAED